MKKKTNDIIKNTEKNKKISREVFEPVLEEKSGSQIRISRKEMKK